MSPLSPLENLLLTSPDSLLVHALGFWDAPDVLKSAVLSSVMHGVVQHYKCLVWDIDKHFDSWFRQPKKFRPMLQVCGAVVSGSQILQFLDRTSYPDSDLDIFLRIGGVKKMGNWLTAQGYRLASNTANYTTLGRQILRSSYQLMTLPTNSPPKTPIRGVYNYRRFIGSWNDLRIQKIQLVCVDMDPIHHILFDFHSTAVMNYLTADKVVSLFPISTFVLRKSYVSKIAPETATPPGWKTKYHARGFRIIQKRSRGGHGDLILGKRHSADGLCWIMKLEAPPKHKTIYGSTAEPVRFDVMHWRSGITQDHCFMRIAEPGIWR
ncbi:hypothetical protein B0H11DRAFT_1912374 [Mycena galericulata]|nr:hypothetical protein B0H11DRAFT_1912374 [Mycena galericulata]